MDNRKQFTFYLSIYESACRIKNKAARADFYDAVCKYALTGEEPNLDKLTDAAAVGFISVKPNLEASRKKAKSGKSGGSAKQTASKPQANAKQTASEEEGEGEYEYEYEGEYEKESLLSSSATAAEDNKAAAATPAGFDLFWEKYPNKVCMRDAVDAWNDICLNENTPALILAGLDRWNNSLEWEKENGRYVPRPARWLSELRWQEHPKEKVCMGATGKLGDAELEAIQRLLKEES